MSASYSIDEDKRCVRVLIDDQEVASATPEHFPHIVDRVAAQFPDDAATIEAMPAQVASDLGV